LAARNRLFSNDIAEFQQIKIDEAKRHKLIARDLYSKGDYFDSLTHIHKAVKTFKVQQLDEQLLRENEAVYGIIKECYLFSASCYIKINQFEQAVSNMDQLLEVENDNFKALFLRGKAYLKQGEVLLAYQDFSLALEIDPRNQTIRNHIKKLFAQYPDIEEQSGQMQRQNPQQFDRSNSQLSPLVEDRAALSVGNHNNGASHVK
jgi:tetratricopeptide (TPR) repeat protein